MKSLNLLNYEKKKCLNIICWLSYFNNKHKTVCEDQTESRNNIFVLVAMINLKHNYKMHSIINCSLVILY